jgi:hypothetical protein
MDDIEQKIHAFAKQQRIHPSKFKAFRDSILNGLRSMRLRTDRIELDKFKAIAKKQGVDIDGK